MAQVALVVSKRNQPFALLEEGKCDVCGKVFLTPNRLSCHTSRAHRPESLAIRCFWCTTEGLSTSVAGRLECHAFVASAMEYSGI